MLATSDGPSGRVSLRKASSSASAGSAGLSRHERLAQPLRQHDLAVVVALGGRLARRDLGAVADGPAGAFEPGEGGLLDDGFGEAA